MSGGVRGGCGAVNSVCSRLSGGFLWGRQRGRRIDNPPHVYNLAHAVTQVTKEWLA
jgi:hypothetical protein